MKFVKETVRIGWNDIDARFDIQKINLRLREVYGPNRAHLKSPSGVSMLTLYTKEQ